MVSSIIYRFRRQITSDDIQSLYNSIRFLNDTLTSMDNVRLRHSVVNQIFQDTKLSELALEHEKNCQNIKDYCNKFKNGKVQCQEVELSALARECHLVIHVLLVQTISPEEINVRFVHYGDLPEPYEQCVFILYDEKRNHYDPLYAANNDKIKKRFNCLDRDIYGLLKTFVQEELHYYGNLNLDMNDKSHSSNGSFDRSTSLMTLDPTGTSSNGRKRQNHENLLPGQITEPVLPWCLNEDTVLRKRQKLSAFENIETSIHNSTAPQLELIKKSSSKSLPTNQFSMCEISKIVNDSMKVFGETSSCHELQLETFKFEYNPAKEFRGRLLSEFEPKKAEKKDGKPSELPPRYFSDEYNNNCFNLLIRNAYLTGNFSQYRFEICIVTPEINGYHYMHPLFQFRVHSKDSQAKLLNPIYLYLNNELEVTKYSEEFLQLQLQFVIVMHTQRELMNVEQPLPIFSSSKNNNNRAKITTIFDEYEAFVNGYDLSKLHFAITPWSKSYYNENFHRDHDKQYISEASRQDKKARIQGTRGKRAKECYENLCNYIFENIEM